MIVERKGAAILYLDADFQPLGPDQSPSDAAWIRAVAPNGVMYTLKGEARAVKYNPSHRPPGPGGGQFAPREDGGGSSALADQHQAAGQSKRFATFAAMPVPTNEGILAAEENWRGGLADLGDPQAALDIQLMHGYSEYKAALEANARAVFGDQFTVYRSMSNDEHSEWESGADLSPKPVTFNPAVASAWDKLAQNAGEKRAVFEIRMPVESIVMRGAEEESEIVVDLSYAEARSAKRIKAVRPQKNVARKPGVVYIDKFNPLHRPAGSPGSTGGQFAPKDEGDAGGGGGAGPLHASRPSPDQLVASGHDVNPEGRPPAPAGTPKNPLDSMLTQKQKADALAEMSKENKAWVDPLLAEMHAELGVDGATNIKTEKSLIAKGNRPYVLEERPWWNVEYVRDSFRFKTIADVDQMPEALKMFVENARASGHEVSIIKLDTGKLTTEKGEAPNQWGWRVAPFDLRMPNGQIAEYYMAPRELVDATEGKRFSDGYDGKGGLHQAFENWRYVSAKTIAESDDLTAAYIDDLRISRAGYRQAWESYLTRSGQTNNEVLASATRFAAAVASVTSEKPAKSP